MKNIIFLAMSTLPSPIRVNNYNAPDGTQIKDCRSQLEPVVRYIMKQCSGQDVYIMSMATTDTLSDRIIYGKTTEKRIVEGREIEEIKINVEEPKSEIEKQQAISNGKYVTSAQGYFEDRIEGAEERKNLNECLFSHTVICLRNPEEAIQESIREIKSLRDKVPGDEIRLWIDTHGGIRDVAVLINVVGYLLQEFEDFKIAGIYGTETANNNIVDQKNAFYSLAFVSGMSDFMNFGNVDVLKKYYQSEFSGGDKDIRNLIGAMQMVSDGTQFCDPYLYKEGLNALCDAIACHDGAPLQAEKALLPIFYDTIKKDYGNLLDKDRRSDLDIIERCMNKKQYQQALTFTEALMPEYFFEKRIWYFSSDDEDKVKAVTKKSYKSAISNALDSYLESINNCFNNPDDIRNKLAVKTGILAGVRQADQFAPDIAEALLKSNAPKDLTCGMKTDFNNRSMISVNGVKIKFETDIPEKDRKKVRRVMQMHRVLKDARNKFNHAVEGNAEKDLSKRRPELRHVLKVMESYISEVRELEKILERQV